MTLKSLPNCRRSVRNDMRLFLRTKHYPVLLRTTKWKVLLQYYSTILYSKVLLQYYSATKYYSSPTPVLQSTTKCYSVLQRTTPVLQSTTPVLLCTTKYFSSSSLYCKVLLQYYSVRQSNTQDWSSSHLKRHLQCAEQQETSNLTKYCTWHAKRLACFILAIELHQILHLPQKVIGLLNPHHIWSLIYNARSNRCPPPTSPNTAPATQNDSPAQSSSHMKRHLQCAEQQVSRSNLTKYCACHAERLTYLVLITYEASFTMRGATGVPLQPHQILRLPRKMTFQNFWENLWKQLKRHLQCGDDPRMIRPWSASNRRKWGGRMLLFIAACISK